MLGFIKRFNIAFFILISYNIANFGKYHKEFRTRKEVKIMLFSPKEKGQGMVEYALIIVLIAIVVIVVLTLLGTQISSVFQTIADALAGTGA